jgi:glucose-6-phosphate 1-epimerase
MLIRPLDFHGLPALAVQAPDGAQAVVTLYGAHVVSWRVAGSAQEQLYLSPASQFGAGASIRGGVPVIFPQFSDRGPGVRHGFARNRNWQQVTGAADQDDPAGAQLVLRLVDDAQSRAQWPHSFALDMAVQVQGNTLRLQLSCTNTGTSPLDFHAALHTYLAVPDVARLQLHGLAGVDFEDCVAGVMARQDAKPLQIAGELDRVYAAVHGELCLVDDDAYGARARVIAQQGFADVVVWNPGPVKGAALADMPPDGYRHMLCVEAAQVCRPVTLAPGASWSGVQTLSVSP